MDSSPPLQDLKSGSQDTVLAVSYNVYGDRLATASADHSLKVWERKEKWMLVDSWRAHDAEITEVKWSSPFGGQYLGSIGEDGYFKLWTESKMHPPRSGQRFRLAIPRIASKSKLPWMSVDFRCIDTETYLALVTRDGNLSLLEPRDHDNLAGEWLDWMSSEDFYVCRPPSRSEEASFKVAFHQEKLPCWTALQAGLDRRCLSLAVAVMDSVKIYRTDKDRRIYLAAGISAIGSLVRGLSWSNGAMRGFDVIATACKDGVIRVYELHTPKSRRSASSQLSTAPFTQQPRKTSPSGIGAGLAGISQASRIFSENDNDPSHIKHTVRLVGELLEHQGAVWRVCFSSNGDLLTSSGDDGSVRTWKRGISGQWLELVEIDAKELQQSMDTLY